MGREPAETQSPCESSKTPGCGRLPFLGRHRSLHAALRPDRVRPGRRYVAKSGWSADSLATAWVTTTWPLQGTCRRLTGPAVFRGARTSTATPPSSAGPKSLGVPIAPWTVRRIGPSLNRRPAAQVGHRPKLRVPAAAVPAEEASERARLARLNEPTRSGTSRRRAAPSGHGVHGQVRRPGAFTQEGLTRGTCGTHPGTQTRCRMSHRRHTGRATECNEMPRDAVACPMRRHDGPAP